MQKRGTELDPVQSFERLENVLKQARQTIDSPLPTPEDLRPTPKSVIARRTKGRDPQWRPRNPWPDRLRAIVRGLSS